MQYFHGGGVWEYGCVGVWVCVYVACVVRMHTHHTQPKVMNSRDMTKHPTGTT